MVVSKDALTQARSVRGQRRESAKTPWTDDELASSVEVYVLLLRLRRLGFENGGESVAQSLLSAPLALRNDAAVRYRMRNISAVIAEFDVEVLHEFSPAERVGSRVRERIRAQLLRSDAFASLLRDPKKKTATRGAALQALKSLDAYIRELEDELTGIGHNQPPEPIDGYALDPGILPEVRRDVRALEIELSKEIPDRAKINEHSSQLIRLGVSLARWSGERITRFADAALKYAAPIVVAKISGLMPLIVSAVEAVINAVSS